MCSGVATALVLALAGCGGDDDSGSPARTVAVAPTATAPPAPSMTAPPPPTATASPLPTATPPPSPLACADLAGRSIAGATLTGSESLPADDRDPDTCLVRAVIESTIVFELRLPQPWNGKLVMLGGGGYDGTIPAPNVPGTNDNLLADGYATVGTDSGHSGSVLDGSWALDDPVALENYAFRAWHTVLPAARAIIAAHYAAAPRRAYFHGGSSGGREALIMAQRYPDDYDGVVARAPALNFVAIQLNASRIVRHVYSPGGWLSPATASALGQAVRDACDAIDGLADGMVSHVEGCHFDAAALRCAGAPDESCLTPAQLSTVETVHSPMALPFALANGVDHYPRYPVGGEESPGGWPLWIAGFAPSPPGSLLFTLSDEFVKYFVARDAQADSLRFAPLDHQATLQALSELLDATDPDLSRFAARGGKVILWHGWSDYALSAYSTIEYYRAVVDAAGGQAAADAFVRLYLSPGIDHVNGGAGAPIFDLVGPLDAWVEEGNAPGDLTAYKIIPPAAEPIPYRPLCRYPTYPRYTGGDPNHSSSFACTPP